MTRNTSTMITMPSARFIVNMFYLAEPNAIINKDSSINEDFLRLAYTTQATVDSEGYWRTAMTLTNICRAFAHQILETKVPQERNKLASDLVAKITEMTRDLTYTVKDGVTIIYKGGSPL